MSIFPQGSAKKDLPFKDSAAPARDQGPAVASFEPAEAPFQATQRQAAPAAPQARESVIASDLTIEGKISGSGHVRIAGKFKGDVKVQGNLTIEQGAKVAGGVAASKVTLAGELEGNIASAQQVELLQSGVINGDLKAGSLTVAAGSRIRGHVECGWDKDGKSASKTESGSAA